MYQLLNILAGKFLYIYVLLFFGWENPHWLLMKPGDNGVPHYINILPLYSALFCVEGRSRGLAWRGNILIGREMQTRPGWQEVQAGREVRPVIGL